MGAESGTIVDEISKRLKLVVDGLTAAPDDKVREDMAVEILGAVAGISMPREEAARFISTFYFLPTHAKIIERNRLSAIATSTFLHLRSRPEYGNLPTAST